MKSRWLSTFMVLALAVVGLTANVAYAQTTVTSRERSPTRTARPSPARRSRSSRLRSRARARPSRTRRAASASRRSRRAPTRSPRRSRASRRSSGRTSASASAATATVLDHDDGLGPGRDRRHGRGARRRRRDHDDGDLLHGPGHFTASGRPELRRHRSVPAGRPDGHRRSAGALARALDLRRDLGREPLPDRRRQHDERHQGVPGQDDQQRVRRGGRGQDRRLPGRVRPEHRRRRSTSSRSRAATSSTETPSATTTTRA